jgi:hypothetical protein
MRRRVIGGIAGWIIGALPLISVNIATYVGFYIENPVLIGATALLAGLILGGIASGWIGGRPSRLVSGGALGAGISGGISALLFAVTIIALVIFAPSLGGLPALPVDQLVHVIIAVLFCAALLLGISMLTGVFAGRGLDDYEEDQALPARPAPRSTVPYQNQLSVPRQPNRMYNDPKIPSQPMRGEGRRSQPTTAGRSESYRGYPPGRPSGPRHQDRDTRSR